MVPVSTSRLGPACRASAHPSRVAPPVRLWLGAWICIYTHTYIHTFIYIHIWRLARLEPVCRASAHPSRAAPPGGTVAWRPDIYIYIQTYITYIHIYIYGA